jgi:hypothetical protein
MLALSINHEYVDDEVFLTEFRQLGGLNIDPNHPAARQEAATLSRVAEERVIASVLLRQGAAAQGMTATPEEIELRREQQWGTSSASVCGVGVHRAIGDGVLVEKYCNWITRHEPRPSRSEVENYYRNRREDFRVPEQVQLMQTVRNIYLPEDEAPAMSAMEQAEAELSSGAPFRAVAERHSDCGGKTELGWVRRGEMVDAFEDVAFATPKGSRSSIFRTVFGLHIVSVLDRKTAGYQSFEEVRLSLAQQMLKARKDRRIQTEIAEMMRRATIQHVPANRQDGVR